jgi:hypothetical protein
MFLNALDGAFSDQEEHGNFEDGQQNLLEQNQAHPEELFDQPEEQPAPVQVQNAGIGKPI